jgi:ankyrin repeat protein
MEQRPTDLRVTVRSQLAQERERNAELEAELEATRAERDAARSARDAARAQLGAAKRAKASREADADVAPFLFAERRPGECPGGSILTILAQAGYVAEAVACVPTCRTAAFVGRDSAGGLPDLWDVLAKPSDRNPYDRRLETRLAAMAATDATARMRALLRDHNADMRAHSNEALCTAARFGKIGAVELLLAWGVNINFGRFEPPLSAAARGNKLRVVEFLLLRGADVRAFEDAAIKTAMEEGRVELMKLFVSYGANLSACEKEYIEAAGRGCLDIVNFVLDRKAFTLDQHCRAALEAAAFGHAKLVELLELLGASYDVDEAFLGALESRCLEGVKFCLDRGLGNLYNYDAAIRLAAETGSLEIVEVLVAHCPIAKPLVDELLLDSLRHGYLSVSSYLISLGGDAKSIATKALSTLELEEWKESDDDLAVVDFLLEHGADVNAENGTPLRGAAQSGKKLVVERLLDRGANVNLCGALVDANGEDNVEIVDLLIARGADVRGDDDAALNRAAIRGEDKVVRLFLKLGADPHSGGGRALCSAAKYVHQEVVKILLAAGVDVHAKDELPLKMAVSTLPFRRNLQVVKALLEAGANVHAVNDEDLQGLSEESPDFAALLRAHGR